MESVTSDKTDRCVHQMMNIQDHYRSTASAEGRFSFSVIRSYISKWRFFVKTFCFCKRPERYRDSPVTETEKKTSKVTSFIPMSALSYLRALNLDTMTTLFRNTITVWVRFGWTMTMP